LPGTLTATVFGDQIQAAFAGHGSFNGWFIAGALLLLIAASVGVKRWLLGAQSKDKSISHASH